MSNLISEMTKQGIEEKYNEVVTLRNYGRGTYKDMVLLDDLEFEIDSRGYYWQGWELMEGDE